MMEFIKARVKQKANKLAQYEKVRIMHIVLLFRIK